MDSIGDRIKRLRKQILNKTQKDFGNKIGLKPNSVSDIESGKNNPSEQTIKAICREFNVTDEWLRTGSGNTFEILTRSQEIGVFANEIMDLPDEKFKKRFVDALSKLDEKDWEALEIIADKLFKEG